MGTMKYAPALKLCEVLKTGVFKTKTELEEKHEMEIFSEKRIPEP